MPRRSDKINLMDVMLDIKKKAKKWNAPRESYFASHYECKSLNARTRFIFSSIVAKYSKVVHFSKCEIKVILLLFQEISGGNVEGLIKEDDFRDFLITQFDITDPLSLECIEKAFRMKTRSKGFTASEFLLGLSVYIRGTVNERIKFCFKAFDYDDDGNLKRKEEFMKYLKNSFDQNSEAVQSEIDPEEPYRETSNYLMSKFNKTNANINEINQEIFREVCNEDPLLMECLAPLFPSEGKIILFQQLLCSNVYTTSYLKLKSVSHNSNNRQFISMVR